jgi:hypothetical protein
VNAAAAKAASASLVISRALDVKWTRQMVSVTNLLANCYCSDSKHNNQVVLAVY